LLAGVLVDERAPDDGHLGDLGGQRDGARGARVRPPGGVDDPVGRLVEHPVVVGLEPDPNSLRHELSFSPLSPYFVTEVTTPAPTVRPPSRMAKRRPSSMAIGVPSSTASSMLSPCRHSWTPAGS